MQSSKKDDPFEIAGWIAKSRAGELSEREEKLLEDLRFGFNMSRHEMINPVLQVFELNGKVSIIKDGKVLIIRRGR